MRFIFLTKTEWSEPPRIRHQLAELLISEGHSVAFVQKSKFLASNEWSSDGSGLSLARHGHLLHHQFKFLSPARWLDKVFIKQKIRSLFAATNHDDVIVNFNYDYYFLSSIFPKNPIIHIVNDDFPAAATRLNRRSATRLQALTAADACHSLCVSYPLADKIRMWTSDCSLFFPWARHRYSRPKSGQARAEALYWGYINERLDFDAVTGLLDAGTTINFFGHVSPSPRVSALLGHPNSVYHGISTLENIPEVLSRCCCAVLPLDATNPVVSCITINNRSFELLSFGLPLLYTKLPGLIEAPEHVIYRCETVADFVAAFANARENFNQVQDDIKTFLEEHYSEARYRQFIRVVEACKEKLMIAGGVPGAIRAS